MTDFGFRRTPSAAQKRRNEEVKFRKDGTTMQTITKTPGRREPFAMELMLDKAFKHHSDGKLSSVELSDIISGLARAAYPDDPKSMTKLVDAFKAQFSAKLQSDYARSQRARGADFESQDLAEVREDQRRRSIGDGVGIGPNVSQTHVPASAANYDDGVPSPTGGAMASASKRFPNLVTKENVQTLMKKYGLSFDAACTTLARGGK